jgi:type VII secretion protein EccB
MDTRDEVAAQRFRDRRLRAALLEGDPDSSTRPLSRLGAGVYGGILVTVLLLAVAGIYGALRPGGSTAWQDPGAFIVDDDTGARYVYLDGVLHPVLNYTSARLLLGDSLHVVSVSSASLQPAARGAPIGIPMAPDSLPHADRIVGPDWSVCAVGRAVDGERLRTEIRPGVAAAGTPVDDSSGYLIRTPAGDTHLLWSGHAYEIPSQWLRALRYGDSEPIEVPDSFVSALPAGPPLIPPRIDGVGEPGPQLSGSAQPTTVGQVMADRTNAHYVITRDGLASLTPLQAQLLIADPDLTAAYGGADPTPLKVSQAHVTEAMPAPLLSDSPVATPAVAPDIVAAAPGEQQLCARYHGGAEPDLVVGPAEATPAGAGDVRLEPGTGAMIAPPQGTDSAGSTVYLVTDTGIRFPLADRRTSEALGLAEAPVAMVPPELLTALPVGPTLDPAVAAAPAE